MIYQSVLVSHMAYVKTYPGDGLGSMQRPLGHKCTTSTMCILLCTEQVQLLAIIVAALAAPLAVHHFQIVNLGINWPFSLSGARTE